jgi:hypothetical protein
VRPASSSLRHSLFCIAPQLAELDWADWETHQTNGGKNVDFSEVQTPDVFEGPPATKFHLAKSNLFMKIVYYVHKLT